MGRALPSNALRIRLYIKTCREYQAHLDSILEELHKTVDNLHFGLDPGVNDSGKFHGDRVHMSKRGSSLARCILHMIAINNLKVDKAAKAPVNPVIYDYYIRKCASKKKIVAVGAVMHKICNIIFAMLRDNKPFELITPKKHCERYAVEHPGAVNIAA